jgi:acetyltransferase-like isoleucine patch superfamily enzyme
MDVKRKKIRLIISVLSIHKYPRYFLDIYVNLVLQNYWKYQGIVLGKGIVWHGKPIIEHAIGSTMCIGSKCMFISRSSHTALGVNHPVIFRTLMHGAELRIGSGNRMSGTTICSSERVSIGDRCVFGANAIVVDTDFHSLDPSSRSSPNDALLTSRKPVEIGDDVFIGCGSIILKGVRIGNCAVIGAGSVVTNNVPEFGIVAGNPAKLIGKVETAKI